MAVPVIAAVAAPAVNSATSEDGLLNKLFKIGILVMVLGGLVISFFILNLVISVADLVGASVSFVVNIADIVLPGTGAASLIVAGVSGLVNSFLYGGKR